MNKFSRALSVAAISCSFWMALYAQQPASAAAAGVPRLIKFSGTVKAAIGQALAGTTGLTFAVYQNQQGGAALWVETQNVELDSQGNYTVLLGSTTSDGLPMDLFISGDSRWLGVQAQGQDEQPRVLLVSVPYALKAADAETLGGKPLSAFVLTDPQASASSSGSSTTTTVSSATDSGQRIISRLATTVGGSGFPNFVASWDGTGVNLQNTSAPIYDDGNHHVGIGTTTPAYLLDVNGDARVNGTTFVNSGGGYTHWDLPYNMNLISAGNNYTGFGYNWQYLYNSGSPFLNKPAPDSSMWMQFSNSQVSFNYNTSTTVGAMTSTTAAVILNNGNVGIGTTTPTSKLHVSSNNNADSNYTFENTSSGFGSYVNVKANSPFASALITSSDGQWAFGRFGGTNSFQIQDITNSKQPFVIEGNSTNNALYITAAGNVGLGTYQPAAKLDVQGNVNITGTVTASGSQSFSGISTFTATPTGSGVNQGSLYIDPASAIPGRTLLGVAVGGTQKLAVDSSGNLTVSGSISSSGSITATGNLNLPNTNGAGTAGLITLGGLRFLHNFGTSNTFVGHFAGNLTMTGQNNTANGYGTLQLNTTGGSNTADGMYALQSNTTGGSNTATGLESLSSNTNGNENTAIGYQALDNNTTGTANTATGTVSLAFNTTGSSNTAFGGLAGSTLNFANANTTGSNNTFLGYNSGPGASTQYTNATAIGSNAVVSASNALVLGSINGVNGATSSVKVGIGTAAPKASLEIAGGDVYVSTMATGLILKSPDGTKCARISLDNSGALTTGAVSCP